MGALSLEQVGFSLEEGQRLPRCIQFEASVIRLTCCRCLPHRAGPVFPSRKKALPGTGVMPNVPANTHDLLLDLYDVRVMAYGKPSGLGSSASAAVCRWPLA